MAGVSRAGAGASRYEPEDHDVAAAAPAAPPSGATARAATAARASSTGAAASVAVAFPPSAPLARSEAIAKGAATRKSDGPEGTEPILAPRHERRIERLFADGSPAAAALDRSLASIGGKDAPLARALFLKAAAARSDALLGCDAGARERALGALASFARRVDGAAAKDLLAGASVLDLDSRVSTSSFDPLWLDAEGSVVSKGGKNDTKTNNDGLFQRFTATCGTTTLQMLLCEEDPLRAFAAHDAGLTSTETGKGDVVADFQRETLERYGGVALSKVAVHAFLRVKLEMGALRRTSGASQKDIDALGKYLRGESPSLSEGGKRALSQVRARAGGFPSDADLKAVRDAGLPKKDEGLGYDEFAKALGDELSSVTGVRYERAGPKDGIARGGIGKYLDQVEKTLAKGIDVPFGMTEPAHWMLLSAVSGKAPARKFLTSDPWTGATAWVGEKELVSGKFSKEPFDLSKPSEKGYIDSFYLPVEA